MDVCRLLDMSVTTACTFWYFVVQQVDTNPPCAVAMDGSGCSRNLTQVCKPSRLWVLQAHCVCATHLSLDKGGIVGAILTPSSRPGRSPHPRRSLCSTVLRPCLAGSFAEVVKGHHQVAGVAAVPSQSALKHQAALGRLGSSGPPAADLAAAAAAVAAVWRQRPLAGGSQEETQGKCCQQAWASLLVKGGLG